MLLSGFGQGTASLARAFDKVEKAQAVKFRLRTTFQNGQVNSSDVTVSGNIAAKYQDVAEWVEAVEEAPAGTVMTLTERGRDEVRPASHAYDTAVAGVISPQPGVILGERGPGKALVAHSGRVRVKVDATYGAIRAGDLLVTSPTPGHAMRSTPLNVGEAEFHRPGTLLGKAIEPLAEGTGEILVLLTLQ